MLTPHGQVVIDWSNATEGPPNLDVALSAVILAQIAVDGIDGMAEPARAFLQAFSPIPAAYPARRWPRPW
jgi:hypothetical protein